MTFEMKILRVPFLNSYKVYRFTLCMSLETVSSVYGNIGIGFFSPFLWLGSMNALLRFYTKVFQECLHTECYQIFILIRL